MEASRGAARWINGPGLRRKCVAQAFDERGTSKHFRKYFLDVFDIHKSNASLDALRHVLLDIRAICRRRQDRLDARTMRRQYLFLESSNGEDPPNERDLTGHSDIWTDRRLREERDECGQQRRARARTLLADAALRHVNVYVAVVQDHGRRVFCHTERVCVRLGPAQRDLGALADDFAQLARQL